ncbi:hypothetical protein GN156_18265 [bacterium LRH843]|nr:hypothetical protein [bacterium LRH843]
MTTYILNDFLPFYSASYTRKYLTNAYEQKNILQPKSRSYQVSYSFMYHLQHGQLYFEQAMNSPVELKPILLFYGLVQLIKGCILTIDPDYPENSQVLAHGVTTRKRKKANYRFLDDEVKTQTNGLFPHFLDKMFHVKQLSGEKYQMLTLLRHVADMHPLFVKIQGHKLSYKGQIEYGNLIFPAEVLDSYHMTPNRFEQYLETFKYSEYANKERIIEQNKQILIPLSGKPSSLFAPPWLFNQEGIIHLLNNKEETAACLLPELAIHYLLLYNLSMISRYEAEWWGELLHTFDGMDLPFVLHYLKLAEEKVPKMISTFLNK